MRIDWNEDWGFTKEYSDELLSENYPQDKLEKVRIPHTCAETSYHYFEASAYEMVSGYRKEFEVPEEWREKNVLITFEGAAQETTVLVNGEQILVHRCGYTAFTIKLNEHLKYGCKNVIVVKLDSRETLNQPPFGNVIDYMTYGGIYREVYLEIKNKVYIEEVNVIIENVLDVTKLLRVSIKLSEDMKEFRIKQTLLDMNGHEKIAFTQLNALAASYGVTDVALWSPEQPNLYQLRTEFFIGDELMDTDLMKIGFRKAEFLSDGFYLNGKKRKLRGLNRHQSFAYVGYAMPERVQRRDVDILVDELHVNTVRTSHYPQSHHFLDACDERGLLVFTEIPGWQHLGDEEWKEQVVTNVEEMITQYRNHPSIILWGVRVNESLDDDKLYKKTNDLAHRLDPTRPTGGVRYLQKSHLLEDVYTYNDFLHKGTNAGVSPKKKVTSDMKKGYLISEFNGHMYPAKMFDRESVRLELALRTANVMNGYYEQPDIAGGYGWCMFDYNTHHDFGSGDKICYHGAMDMFRNPKLSAAVYASQSDTAPVLEVSSSMDIGEHPGGNIGTVYAFTNADSIKLYKNDEFVKEYFPDKLTGPYKSMPHPPIAVNDFVGELLEKHEKYNHKTAENLKKVLYAVMKYGMNDLPWKYKRKMIWLMMTKFISLKKATELYGKYIGNWGGKVTTYKFEAIQNKQVVKTINLAPQTQKILEADTDTDTLVENHTYDVASVRIRMKDENGNLLYYYQEPLKLEVSGAIALIGPDIISLKGGCFGTYVKSTGKSGEGILKITTNEGQVTELKFHCLA